MYVIAEPLAEGYSVLLLHGEHNNRIGHYQHAQEAVFTALRLLHHDGQARAAS